MTRPGRPAASRWSGAVAAWCALWLVVGVFVSLGSTPLVGDRTEELGQQQITRSSADIVTQAEGAPGSLRQLAVLLGLTMTLGPSVPAVVPLRLGGGRDPQPWGG